MKALLGQLRVPLMAAALLYTAGGGTTASAQTGDAFVLPRGLIRASVGGEFTYLRGVHGSGGTLPFATALNERLTSATFAPLQPVELDLNRFLADTDEASEGMQIRATPENLVFGEPEVVMTGSIRRVPLRLDVGVAPRIEIGIGVPILQGERLVQHFAVSGGTVGANPSRQANQAVLARIDPSHRALGGAEFLPTRTSALGRALQQRVRALTDGDSLLLPTAAADTGALQALLRTTFGVPPIRSRVTNIRAGDVELRARVSAFGNMAAAAYPENGGLKYRTAASVELRLPTGTELDTLPLLPFAPETGITGVAVGFAGDLFLGARFWMAAAARYRVVQDREVEQRVVPTDRPLLSSEPARLLTWSRGPSFDLRVSPRFRLMEEISIGLEYATIRSGANSWSVAGGGDAGSIPLDVLDVPRRTAQVVGAGIRYTTLPGHAAGRARIPMEVNLGWSSTLGGTEGSHASSTLHVELSLFRRVWGAPRPAAPIPEV